MNAAEALYFDRAPLAHVVAWEERRRLAARQELARRLLRERAR